MNPPTLQAARSRISALSQMPSVHSVLRPLLDQLQRPVDSVNLFGVVELISCDKSLAAQCLRMANSPLFGHSSKVESVRGAVVALGLRRVREIVLSCFLLQLAPARYSFIDPVCFWEHSLGCALVARRLARRVNFPDRERAYLAGLLHDLGSIVNLTLFPQEFAEVLAYAKKNCTSIHFAEKTLWSFTHCDTGALLAEQWRLPDDLVDVIRYHHDFERTERSFALVAMTRIADLLCRLRGLGVIACETGQLDLSQEPAWVTLQQHLQQTKDLDVARLTFEIDAYTEEVKTLVSTMLHAA